jgi:pyrroloquinoline quinone biosynthesis protein B
MQIVLLGTAAGGGFPQWNCWCPTCRVARADPARAVPRSQSAAAVSADGERWFLLNASPDVHAQLRRLTRREPSGTRHSPVEGVILTDAELDHSLGLVLLREARYLPVAATSAVQEILAQDSGILRVTSAFAEVRVTELAPGRRTPLAYRDGCPSGIAVTPFVVPAGPPRFARADHPGHTVGLVLEDESTGGTAVFAPGCGGIDPVVEAALCSAELVLFDGTFWRDDELILMGISDRTARQMDHLPVAGPGGSLERLATLPARTRVYTHINNSNPMLLEDSPERAEVERHGLRVGADGMRFSL